ncbi:MAG TPA: pyridoxamine 5'-phosphate oxidase family protein [Dongiaceae bacterium]|nr:pyridoxamine 5'-phosphate oxidase family protein [Dongiaceae bacterium]
MNTDVTDFATLEACVGKVPGPRDLKVIDHLDAWALRWIAVSPFFFITLAEKNGGGIHITAGGGEHGCVQASDARHLRVPLNVLDDSGNLRVGQSFGSLFLVPGLGETLRVNGRVQTVTPEWVDLEVAECYLHCAKALMRSDFWQASPSAVIPANTEAFLAATRFIALASVDQQGDADVSPKGDPAGTTLRLHDESVWYADRPGNRRVDSFRNILSQPRIALMALIPGSNQILLVEGAARITTDATMREAFKVQDKAPNLTTCVSPAALQVRESAALARARLWPSRPAPQDLDPTEIFKTHVKLNKSAGLQAGLARAAISIPGLMKKGLQHDYKKNMY